MDKVYEMNRNVDHVKANQDYDVWQVIQNRKEKFKDLFWWFEPIKELPPYKFEGKIDKRLSWLDYPRDKFGYPIVSKKLVDLLSLTGEFEHKTFPLTIQDWKTHKTTDNFVFLHLLENIDALNRERTEFHEASGRVRNAALIEPESGYPPLFRVKDASLKWFISGNAREALEAADIKGVSFIPLIAS